MGTAYNEYSLLNNTKVKADDYQAIELNQTEKDNMMKHFKQSQTQKETVSVMEISEFEKQQLLRNFKESKYQDKVKHQKSISKLKLRGFLVAALVMFMVLGFAFSPKITAEIINYLRDIRVSLSSSLFGASDEMESFIEMGDAQMLGDIPVKLEDVYLTERMLSYNVLVYYPEGNEETSRLRFEEQQVFVNGEELKLLPYEIISDYLPESSDVFQFTNTYYLPQAIDLSNEEIEIDFVLKNLIEANTKAVNEDPVTDSIENTTYIGEVSFDSSVSSEELTANTLSLSTDQVINTDVGNFSFEEIALNTQYPRMLLSGTVNSDLEEFLFYTYKLMVTTDQGEEFVFMQWSSRDMQAMNGSFLFDFRLDEENNSHSIDDLMNAESLSFQLLRYKGLKAPLTEFNEVGESVKVSVD